MNTRVEPNSAGASSWRRGLRPLLGALLLRHGWSSAVRCSLCLLGLGAFCCSFAPARASQQYSRSVTFQTSDQSQWAAGFEYVNNWSQEFSRDWSGSTGGGSFYDLGIPRVCTPAVEEFGVTIIPEICTPAISLGSFGARGTASTSGKIGLRPSVSVSGGDVNVSYPVRVSIQYPDAGTLYPGDSFNLLTSFVPESGGSLTTSSPHARVTVDAILNATFSGSAEVKAFGDTLFNESLSIPPIGSNNWLTVLDTDNDTFQRLAGLGQALANWRLSSATGGILTGGFKNLSIDTSGGLVSGSNSLRSSDEETFFRTRIDYSNAALTAAGMPGFNKDINAAGIHLAFQILDAYQLFDLKVGQTFRFDPTPRLSLQLSTGQTIDLNAGQSTQLTFPTVSAGASRNDLTITPTHSLGNTLTNTTDLIFSPSMNFTPLNITFSGSLDAGELGDWDLPGFSLNPTGTFSQSLGDQTFNLFNQSFPLQGFSSPSTEAFTLVGYTYPVPALASVTPPAFKPGAVTQLSAAGTNFVDTHTNSVTTLPNTTARWNDSDRTTRYGSATQLTFDLSATQANTEGIFRVTVSNPAPGGGASNSRDVIIDGTAPVSTPSFSGPQNADHHGWYKGDVTATVGAQDTLSGVHRTDYQVDEGTYQHVLTGSSLGPGSFTTPSFVVSGEKRHVLKFKSSDNVENLEAENSREVNIDGTVPVVTYSGNAGNYTVDQQVNINCSSADPNLTSGEAGSGVFRDTCQNIVGPAYSFPLGANTFSAMATDTAGNVGANTTRFSVQVTYGSLCNLVQRFVKDPLLGRSLCMKLDVMKQAQDRGDLTVKTSIMDAFVAEVAAQSGKAIKPADAAVLTALARAL
jgi:hypothetical protein